MAAHSVRSACDVVAGHWARRFRPGRKTAAKSEAQVDPDEHTGTPMSRPILAEPRTDVAVGPGKERSRTQLQGVRFDGLPYPGRPGRSGSPSRNRGQAPRSDRSRSGRLRICEWLHPSQLPAGLSSMRGCIEGSNVLPRVRAEARERCDVCPRGAGPGARRRSGPAEKAVRSRNRRSPRLGRSSLP